MVERGWGRVVNVASLAGLGGAPYITAYCASKHALVGLTRALAAEIADSGVTVNAVCPGYAATDLTWDGARRIAGKTGRSFEDAVDAMARLNASGRLVTPDEVAAAVLELVGDQAAGQTGETVVIA
jgi:NAD(P)-dependent dehydrogenase (short-subunit alcohol dehydrogenase family)